MSNSFRDARDELLDVVDEEMDEPQTAKINGKPVRCIIGEMTTDEILVAGGDTEAGGFRLEAIPKESLVPEPEKGDEVIAKEKTLELLTIVERNNSTYEIAAGSLLRGEG